VFSRLAGYEDTNDADRLSVDPAMRHVVGGRAKRHSAASTSHMGRFETDVLTDPFHLDGLMDLSGQWIDRVRERKPFRELILDMDSSVSETYGTQEGTAYNGHFGCTFYHPLFCFNQFGDLERALLREGHVHSADDWHSVLEPIVARYRDADIRRFFRGDAAFANPDIYTFLEEEDYLYAIRLPANQVRLQLFALAHNLGTFLRRLALPQSVKHWSLTTLREKLVKIGAKAVAHTRYVTFQMAEVAIPRRLFRTILRRISRLVPLATVPT